jgi:hypothetical protein
MKRQYAIITILLFCLFCFLIWHTILRPYRENKLEEKGNEIIEKIEYYVEQNGTPPDSLLEIGIDDSDDDFPFYYQKKGCYNYILSFGLSIDESKIFYSDSKRWEYGYREIE